MKRIEAIRRNRAIQRKAVLDRALERLSDYAQPLGLELVPFGSYAKGRVRGQSDLDLAVPGFVSEATRRQLEREAERVEADEGVPIDLMFESEIPVYFRELRETISDYRSSLRRDGGEKIGRSGQVQQNSDKENVMTTHSPDTVFDAIDPKRERISLEIGEGKKSQKNIQAMKDVLDSENLSWTEGRLLALTVHNLYNGVEQILEDIAKVSDDFDPSSASSHADLISLMATKTRRRPAILTPELFAILDDLRKFRHVMRHSYGNPITADEVVEKFDLFQRSFWPQFLESLERYKTHLRSVSNPSQSENSKSTRQD